MLPVLENQETVVRDYAISGVFGHSMMYTDGEWTLHQSPNDDNKPLYWHGYHHSKFLTYELGDYVDCKRLAFCTTWGDPTWLSYKPDDPNELMNLAEQEKEKLGDIQACLKQTLINLNAPSEQLERLQLL